MNFTSHAIKRRQHSIERDVDLHVVKMLEKKIAVLYDRSKKIIIEICRLFWNFYLTDSMNNALEKFYGKSTRHATDVSLAEFCMEMFDGGKWQRQYYFNVIFGIVAQHLVWYEYLLSSECTEFLVCKSRSYSTLELVIMSTNTQRVTLKSSEMSMMTTNNQIIK